MTMNAINYPLPTSYIPIKHGRTGNATYSTSANTYSPIIGCMLACTENDKETSYNSAISACETNQQCPEI